MKKVFIWDSYFTDEISQAIQKQFGSECLITDSIQDADLCIISGRYIIDEVIHIPQRFYSKILGISNSSIYIEELTKKGIQTLEKGVFIEPLLMYLWFDGPSLPTILKDKIAG